MIGDCLRVVFHGPHWTIKDAQSRNLGRLAKSRQPPKGQVFLSGQAGAIVTWRKSSGGPATIQSSKR